MKIWKRWIEKGLRIAREWEKKRKTKKRAVGGGARLGRRRHASSVSWSEATPAKWWHVSPTETRPNRSKPDRWPNWPDPWLHEVVRTWTSRVNLQMVSFSSRGWRLIGTWGRVGGSFCVRLPYVCPNSYFNNIFMWIGTSIFLDTLHEAVHAWPSRVSLQMVSFPSRGWHLVGTWGRVGGSFCIRLPSICPNSYLNNIFMWIGT